MPDTDSFDAFYRATRQRLYGTVYALTGDPSEAQDAVPACSEESGMSDHRTVARGLAGDESLPIALSPGDGASSRRFLAVVRVGDRVSVLSGYLPDEAATRRLTARAAAKMTIPTRTPPAVRTSVRPSW